MSTIDFMDGGYEGLLIERDDLMRRYRVEIIVGAVFLALFLALCYKLSPGPKLTPDEVDAFITRMSAIAMPEPEKTEFLERNRAGARPMTANRSIWRTYCARIIRLSPGQVWTFRPAHRRPPTRFI